MIICTGSEYSFEVSKYENLRYEFQVLEDGYLDLNMKSVYQGQEIEKLQSKLKQRDAKYAALKVERETAMNRLTTFQQKYQKLTQTTTLVKECIDKFIQRNARAISEWDA